MKTNKYSRVQNRMGRVGALEEKLKVNKHESWNKRKKGRLKSKNTIFFLRRSAHSQLIPISRGEQYGS